MTAPQPEKTVRVELRDRAYDIHIGAGLLERASDLLAPHLNRSRAFVVADENAAAAHRSRFEIGLTRSGIDHQWIILPGGEQTKSFSALERLVGSLLDLRVERSDLIVAFGGGVIGDAVGFAAGILRRGCRFAQVPTTLLSQVDSSVGGKTGINVAQGKNLVGLFHQPAIVIADIGTLKTLPSRELRAGFAEVVKYAAIDDSAMFNWLDQNGDALLQADATTCAEAVARCCAKKAGIVAEDEFETGRRALLNLGHTFGHGLEAVAGYDGALLHGEAVAAGMGMAFDYSVSRGFCSRDEARRLKTLLRRFGLPDGLAATPGIERTGPAAISAERLFAAMLQDKKVVSGELTLILAGAIGEAFIDRTSTRDDMIRFLKACGAA